jgi:hypothetical protein
MHTNNNHNTKVDDFPKAPASWNTKFVDPNGFECQITLRGESGSELLEKAANAIHYLIEKVCTPYVYYRNTTRQVETMPDKDKKDEVQNNNTDNPAWCPIHQCEMKSWDKGGCT